MEPHERAAAGLFLGFQYPVEIPGVSYLQFLRESLNSQRRARGEAELSGAEFIKLAREPGGAARHGRRDAQAPGQRRLFGRREEARRDGPDGHHAAASFAVLDETDSGLDIDALQSRRRGHQPHHARARQGRAADHPLPAPARLCGARPRARAAAPAGSTAAAGPSSRTSSSAKAMRRRRRDVRLYPSPSDGEGDHRTTVVEGCCAHVLTPPPPSPVPLPSREGRGR